MTPKLSILIPSLACRTHFLADLLACVTPQLEKNGKGIEILISIDNADKQIGTKRNELLASAKGEYVVFIDDDDMLAPDYIEEVMKALESGCDYISYTQQFHHIHTKEKNLVRSKIGQKWRTENGVYLRGIQHICPIKRSIAIQVPFPVKSFGEDKDWGYKMDKLAKTQHDIDKVLYFYEYRQFKTNETTNGNKS